MTPSASRRIFVSHSHQDNDFGRKLVQDMQNALGDETAVWYDTASGLHGGDPWWSKIKQELKACSVFLVVLSPDAIASKYELYSHLDGRHIPDVMTGGLFRLL